ncbi:PEP-CTERM sorting domain-containing protein [Verrucomicrobiaceae bacterium N1E253]|uniref:PEP-CTERM sorting domain-containing protein n=1 Tax=Oceaniferula marina TaxID=2748318 RepID=A0A851GPP6_9BACT|nr:PEP-CTERM sorting domain-containing protein [Oceaniferula marina]NWK56800.1 PEP-CTERM sorting domain-containing protein [Oceaniferula marina]
MKITYTFAALVASIVAANAALTSTKDYTGSGLDFTGVVNGGYVWGMEINPINNQANVDVDGNGTKDFHESGTTNVDPTKVKAATQSDGYLLRWDYGDSPSRAASLESSNASWTLEFGLNMLNTGTEGSRGVFGIAPEFGVNDTTGGRLQLELERTGMHFQGGIDASTIFTPEAMTASNLGFHTWRIAYDGTAEELFFYRDGVLMNAGGSGIAASTDLGNPSSTFFGDYSSGLSGDFELDYMVLDASGAFAPVPEPSSAALLGLGGLALILRRRK